ncbi:MAG TPA: rod shape-determining protein MreD [Opitutus sp.]|nr:rod shape-determining protein MreD [Opitutus sp.]
MRHPLASFVTLALLWAVVSELNHLLTGWHVYLWVGGLFVTFSAVTLPLRAGLLTSFLGGLLLDSLAPVTFGTQAVLLATAHALIFNVRDRVPREETAARVVIALFANLALFLVFSFLQIRHVPTPATVWPRLIVDLLCSQVFIAVVAPWFFALQARAIGLSDLAAAAYDRRFR